jgi:hypothetical protein
MDQIKTRKYEYSQLWWCTAVIPATQEAEAEISKLTRPYLKTKF